MPALRRFFFRLHLWLGLLLGLYAAGIGLSGAMLVYRPELQRWLEPHLFSPPVSDRIGPDRAVAVVQERFPQAKALTLNGLHLEQGAWMVYLLSPGGGKEVFVDAATGAIRGTSEIRSTWLGWVESMHSNFRSGKTGRLINGYAGWGLVLLALSGLWLWRIRFRGWRGWHSHGGLASLLFIITTGVTGGYFTWYQAYANAVKAVLPARGAEPVYRITTGAQRLTLAQLIGQAEAEFPGTRADRISLPQKASDPVRMTVRHGRSHEFHLISHIVLDPYTGKVLWREALADRPAADRWIGNFSAIHFGIWGGEAGRALWFIGGLALPALFWSGLVLWWRRLRQTGRRALWP